MNTVVHNASRGIRLPVEPSQFVEYRERLTSGPVTWNEELGGWAVLTFDLCVEVETDEARFPRTDKPDMNSAEVNAIVEQMQGGPRSLQLLSGEEHAKLHGGLGLALTRNVRAKRQLTEELARAALADLEGPVEFREAFAELFPATIITAIMGLPWVYDEERIRFARDCATLIGEAMTGANYLSETFQRGAQASRELSEMLRPDIEMMVELEDGNMVAEIYRVGREIFDDWSVEDVLTQCRLLYFAGSESSSHFLLNLMYVLATNPEAWARIGADRSLIPTFIEETLRVVPPVLIRARVAAVDTEVGGVPIAKGERLYLYNAAANRDPERFTRPDELDLDQRPRRHLSFNAGPRTCPGVPTARMESKAFLEALLDSFEKVELDPRKPEPVLVGVGLGGFLPLHLVLTPRSHTPKE